MKKAQLILCSIFLIGFVISCLIYQHFEYLQDAGMREAFEIAAEERFATFEEVIELDVNILIGLRGLFNASDNVDRYEFLVFSNSFVAEDSAFQALGWVPIVDANEKDEHTLNTRYEGFAEFSIIEKDPRGNFRPAASRGTYYPIHFVQPFKRNKHLLGYDLGSNARILEAMRRSRNENRLSITGRVNLVAQSDERYSILAILPVHSKRTFSQADPQYAANTTGFVVGSFLLENIFDKSVRPLKPQGINSYLYDITDNMDPQFLYGHYSRLSPAMGQVVPDTKFSRVAAEDLVTWFDWSVGGRRWRVAFNATDSFISRHQYWESKYYFVLGCIITIITGLLFYRSFQHTFRVEKEVEKRTNELNVVNQQLEQKLEVISDQNEDLERTKKATINILEDLDESKRELEKVNNRLGEQKKVLEKVNLELDRFTYTASHDLRAPLRAISSFASFLRDDYSDKLDEEGQDYLQEIQKGAGRMTRLIDDLLSLSRISRIRNPYEEVDMNDLVRSIIERIEFDIKDYNVELNIQNNMPTIVCDKIKMGEVFLNLINNAIKFSSKDNTDRPSVSIGGKKTEGGYEIFVKDNGIGIDPQFHDQIFDLFKRLQKEKDYDGTGAGLSIVKRIIEDHQGRIWIESELGQGAKFTFFIPDSFEVNQVPSSGNSDMDVPEYMGEV